MSRFRYTQGPKILVELANKILDEVEGNQIKPGSNVRVKRSASGTIIELVQQLPVDIIHNYTVYDASTGATPKISVTPGNHRDGTGGGVWIPTLGGTPISPLPAPTLTVGSSDTVVYFNATIDATTGAFTAFEIDSGTSVPADTSTASYQLCAYITVTIISGVAKVVSNEGGVNASQNYFYCGLLPATDGSGHQYNT